MQLNQFSKNMARSKWSFILVHLENIKACLHSTATGYAFDFLLRRKCVLQPSSYACNINPYYSLDIGSLINALPSPVPRNNERVVYLFTNSKRDLNISLYVSFFEPRFAKRFDQMCFHCLYINVATRETLKIHLGLSDKTTKISTLK